MNKILIIEDDIGISNSLKLYLENSGFEIDIYNSGNGAIEKIKSYLPDLIILDVNLPGKDGMQICKELREFSDIAVIMLTARDNEFDKISGLEIGADDYMSKPFSPRELLARIKIILKRIGKINKKKPKKNNTNILSYKNITLDLDRKIAYIDGNEINFTNNEYSILEKLLKENGKVVTRKTLMVKVLGYDKYIYDRTLDTHIKNIRKKLNDQEIILTVRGKGYRLNK